MSAPSWFQAWKTEWRQYSPSWKDWLVYAILPVLLLIAGMVLTAHLTQGYDPVKVGRGTTPQSCQGVYDSLADPYPSTTGFCHNYSECWQLQSSKTNQEVDWSAFFSGLDLGGLDPVAGSVCRDDGICCVHGYDACYTLQEVFRASGAFQTDLGVAREFSPWIVQHSPIGFAQNPDTPYFTFPIYAFGTKPYLMGGNMCTTSDEELFDLQASGLDKNPAGLPLTTLGAMGLLPNQALVISLLTPPGSFDAATGLPTGCKYFSFTPYLGVVGDPYEPYFQSGISFSSVGNAYNLYDIQRNLIANGAADTSPFSKRLILIYTHNRLLAEAIYATLAASDVSFDLITCLPIPAGQTWGSALDAFGEGLLKSDRTNQSLRSDIPVVDMDASLVISPVLRAAGDSDELATWFTNTANNSTAYVCGVTALDTSAFSDPSQFFTFDDFNGRFKDGTWTGGWQDTPDNPNLGVLNWKLPLPAYTPEAPFASNMQAVIDALTAEFQDAGYDHLGEIGVFRGTFPKWGTDRLWGQVGFETQNYGIQAQGDCSDTYYPVSQNMCVGPNQVAVAVAVNHTALGNSCYNTIAWYDTTSVTAVGSTVSNTLPSDMDGYILLSGVSRTDFRCQAPIPMLEGRMQFAPTGTHRDNLGSPPTVPLVTMERMYCNPYVLVMTSQLHAGDVVTDEDRARGDPDGDYIGTDYMFEDLDLPAGTVLRRAIDYPELAAPQSIKTTSALPFRVLLFSRTDALHPTQCVDVSSCQALDDTTKVQTFTCTPSTDTSKPCPNDGVVASQAHMDVVQREQFARSMILLNGNHKQTYISGSIIFLSLAIGGFVAAILALLAGLTLSTRKQGDTIPPRWRRASVGLYVIVGVLALTDLVLAALRLSDVSQSSQFDLYNAYTQGQAKATIHA